jgi:predicted MFS family arabinose efflux permease
MSVAVQNGEWLVRNEAGKQEQVEPLRNISASGLATGIPALADAAEASAAVHVPSESALPPIFKAFRSETFFYFWSGNFLSNIGTWMQNLAQGWLILELTNSRYSASWLGFVGFIAAIPYLWFTLYGGVIADRTNKRVLLLCTQTAMMVFAFTMAGLAYFKIVTVAEIAILSFLIGVASALNAPVYQAIVPSLVEREDLQNAIALNTVQFNLARILGAALGGYAVALIGVAGNFFLNGLSFFAVIFAVGRIEHVPNIKQPDRVSTIKSLRRGFRYVKSIPEMHGIVWMVASISLLLMPFITFIPFFARNVLHTDAKGLGFMMSCSGIGAFISALLVAHCSAHGWIRHRGRILFGAILGVMVGLLFFCATRSFVTASALMFWEGFAMIASIALLNMSMQELSNDEMRGRVMGIYTAAFLGLPPLGCLIATDLTLHMSTPHAISLMTLCAMACFVTVFASSRALREFN